MGLSLKRAMDNIGGFFDDVSGKTGADAALDASRQIQQNIDRGLAEQSGFQQQAQNQMQGGINQQQGFLSQAGGMFNEQAGLVNPALQNLQQTSTAGGRSSALQGILADPNNAQLFEEMDRMRNNEASQMGIRRSGANMAMGDADRFGMANQLLSNQDASQQNLFDAGMGAQGALANIFAQQGNVAGMGGANMSNLTQQGSRDRMGLLSGYGPAGAAGTLGAANAKTQGSNALVNLGGQLLGGWLGS